MYSIATSKSEHILQLAATGCPVRVLRVATTVPDINGYARPAMRIQYTAQADETTSWTYSEVIEADENGIVHFDGTLLEALAKGEHADKIQLSTVSGSV